MEPSDVDPRQLLFGRPDGNRFTQDSPVLPDVWIAFFKSPTERHDLLLTPFQPRGQMSRSPSRLAVELRKRLKKDPDPALTKQDHQIGINQTTVAVRVSFYELLRTVLPMSSWWSNRLKSKAVQDLLGASPIKGLKSHADTVARLLAGEESDLSRGAIEDLLWMVRVAGELALKLQGASSGKKDAKPSPKKKAKPKPGAKAESPDEGSIEFFRQRIDALVAVYDGFVDQDDDQPLVHLVSSNRKASGSLFSSVKTIKADAARGLFNIDCSHITWAIVDSGIDATHPAFQDRTVNSKRRKWYEKTRVRATYDFTIIRYILSTDDFEIDESSLSPEKRKQCKQLRQKLKKNPELRARIQRRLSEGLDVDWSLILPFIEIPHDDAYKERIPRYDHGTHVAGILGADWRPEEDPNRRLTTPMTGVCPNINLLDIRILDDEGHGDEFSVMAALQFLRYLNSHKDHMVVHGANISLSIQHDVRNFACGRTPICDECERLVNSGLVVVAAAGNRGFNGEEYDMESSLSGFRTVTITDPGNADGVITVGSTHREEPHTYGVSYFSSRGPTGDGRIKPDLVAPGEKIDSTGPNFGLLRKDGTSMAAPHVSGAAALLMARHSEFIRQPRRVKDVLCRTATDLGRERYFQGAGMLDILRALQSV